MLDFNFTCTDGNADYDNLLTLTLSQETSGVVANPHPVWLECTGVTGAAAGAPVDVYDPQAHEIVYVWTFDDAANSVPSIDLNTLNSWKDINKGYGRRVAHTFNDAGTYTVTCTAYEVATRRFGSATIQVTIPDADTVFAGNTTLIYDPNSTADTSGYPTAQVFTDWATLIAARNSIGSGNARILLADDVDLVFGSGDEIINPGNWGNTRIGALAPASLTRPKLSIFQRKAADQKMIRDTGNTNKELVLYGIDFAGEWDAATENGRTVSAFTIDKPTMTIDDMLIMYHRCTFDGFDTVNSYLRRTPDKAFYHMNSETSVTNWQNYGFTTGGGGVFGDPGDVAFSHTAVVGCSSSQHPDALSGGPKNGFYNNHGPLRDFESATIFISVCSFFSRNGWTTGGSTPTLNVTGDQAALRLNTSAIENYTAFVDRFTLEGDIWMREQDAAPPEGEIDRPANYILDKVLQITGPRNNLDNLTDIRYGGTTFRNHVAIKFGLPEASSNTCDSMYGVSDREGSANNAAAGMRLYNATCIDLRDDAQTKDIIMQVVEENESLFDPRIYDNNLLQQPNRSASVPVPGETVNLATITDGFTQQHKGPRFNFEEYENTFDSPVSGAGGTFTIPYTEITDALSGQIAAGNPTDQAYWQAIESTDTLHKIKVNNVQYDADTGEIDVSFADNTNIVITNNSGTEWSGDYVLRLDRASLQEGFDPTLDCTTQSLSITIDATDAETTASGDDGLKAYDDFFGRQRAATGERKGAF